MGNPWRVSIVNQELKAATGRSAGDPSSATLSPSFKGWRTAACCRRRPHAMALFYKFPIVCCSKLVYLIYGFYK